MIRVCTNKTFLKSKERKKKKQKTRPTRKQHGHKDRSTNQIYYQYVCIVYETDTTVIVQDEITSTEMWRGCSYHES